MADIQGTIYEKYGIDIAKENLFKLYKIDNGDISEQELEEKIQATRKRWNQSINGANEKNAERDRARLGKADKYEAILRDAKLRKSLYEFYTKGVDGAETNSAEQTAAVQAAKEYFQLIQTSKQLKPTDMDFFFKYYQSERKYRKAIEKMLEEEFGLIGSANEKDEEGQEEEENETIPEGKTKDESSPVIVSLFQEATVILIHKCQELYEKAKQSDAVCMKYPEIRGDIYDFLKLGNTDTIEQFREYISQKTKEVYTIRQEQGGDYIHLVDLFNNLKKMCEYRDVVDNFSEFKLLIKYSKLTPYMFAFVNMKKKTLNELVKLAKKEYGFRDDADFILSYYSLLFENFGIVNSGINSLLKEAKKKTKSNKILNVIDEKLGRKKKREFSVVAEILHWLVYWPVFAAYLVFELFKIVFTKLHRTAIPVSVMVFVGMNWLLPKFFQIENLFYIRKIFIKQEWYAFLGRVFRTEILSGLEAFSLTVAAIIIMAGIFILPTVFAFIFIGDTTEELNKRYDWFGYERTFKNVFRILRKKTKEKYAMQKNLYFRSMIPRAIINVLCVIVLIMTIRFAPDGVRALSEKTGYFQDDEMTEQEYNDNDEGMP